MQSTSMPEGETLENFARTGATLAIHLGSAGACVRSSVC